MAGSIKTHKYDLSSNNTGNFLYYDADESNLENITAAGGAYDNAGSSIFDYTAADVDTVLYPLPRDGRNFVARKAIYKDASGLRVRIIKIPSQQMHDDLFNRVAANVNITFTENIEGTPVSFILADLKPQYLKVKNSFDTGLDDGDAT